MFALYRNNFATVDTYNKVALGPKSIMHTVRVRKWDKRVAQVLISMMETNAYYAYIATCRATDP